MQDNFSWELKRYTQKIKLWREDGCITQEMANHFFQLEPPPPEEESDTYIVKAIQEKNLDYFSFFLHQYEEELNSLIRRTLAKDGNVRYNPEQFLDIKISCIEILHQLIFRYDPSKEAKFSTYAYRFVKNGIQKYLMQLESWSISSVSTYQKIQTVRWLSNNAGDVLSAVTQKYQCDLETAKRYVEEAARLGNRVDLYATDADGESIEETIPDYSWDYVEIIMDGIPAEAVAEAFDRLPRDEQYFLEKKLGICMQCGRTEPLEKGMTFDELGAIFEFTTANGAEKKYNRSLEHLAQLMTDDNTIRTVTLKQKSISRKDKRITVTLYEYQADGDGEWGEIEFDFTKNTVKILYLAEFETSKSHVYAKKAIEVILDSYGKKLPKKKLVAFPR